MRLLGRWLIRAPILGAACRGAGGRHPVSVAALADVGDASASAAR
jgi:hypothetical protein